MKNNHRILRYFLAIVMVAIMFSCDGRPSNVLSEDKMVDLMVDMELAEAYSNMGHTPTGVGKNELGKQVLKKHGVSEETLDTTLAWYGRNLDDYAELYAKVDKKIMKMRKKYTDVPGVNSTESENLWPYAEHLVLSPLSGANSFTFSFPASDVKQGEILELSFAMANPVGFKSTFGVEYNDGHGEGVVSTFSNKNSIKISLYTDTLRKVSRIFGTVSVKDNKSLPLYIDSLKLMVQPFDTIGFRNSRRSQKHFGPIVKTSPQKQVAKEDTVVNKTDSLETNKKLHETNSDSLKINDEKKDKEGLNKPMESDKPVKLDSEGPKLSPAARKEMLHSKQKKPTAS